MNLEELSNYIGGEYLPPSNKRYLDNINPATGKVIARIPDSDAEDVRKAIRAAKEALPLWKNTPFNVRAKILRKVSELILENADELAQLESRDQGKPLWLAHSMDIPRTVSNFTFFAGMLDTLGNSAIQEQDHIQYTWRDPLGVVALITPWNLPLYLLTWKLAPALAMGNTVVCKPSELTPSTAFFLTKILEKAGLPKGVCNIVFGKGDPCGSALVKDPDVSAISFTGGTQTGLKIYQEGAASCKKISLELGGKNPQIVFADADLEKCISKTIQASFLNQGEICLCTSRLFIEERIYSQFIERFIDLIKDLKVGNPLNSENYLGAVISKNHLNKILSYVELAKKEGGSVLIGGEALKLEGEWAEGYFMPPTVIVGLSPKSKLMQEEIFGPVVCVQSFETEEEVLELANDVSYGLSASVWTENLSKAHRFAQNLEVGQVWVNTWMKRDLRVPFGGVKYSGIGREGGMNSLEFFSQAKNICIQL